MISRKNVFVVDPVNSNYPLQLGKKIAKELGGNCYLISINPGAFVYGAGMGVDTFVFRADRCTDYTSIQNKNNVQLDEFVREIDIDSLELNCIIKKCSNFIENYVCDFSPAVVICYNDLRLGSILFRKLFGKTIPIVYLELGPFRGKTSSFDWQGCNSRSSFASSSHPKDAAGYNDFMAISQRTSSKKRSLLSRPWFFNVQFMLYILHQKLCILVDDKRYLLAHRESNAKYYLKRLLGLHPVNTGWSWGNGPLKVYVPLQLELDTQFQINRYFKSNQEFINKITELLFYDQVEVIFRPHPLDSNVYEFNRCVKIDISNNEALCWADSIVTINSTVGFEALTLKKKVFCFSKSFYTSLSGVVMVTPHSLYDNLFSDDEFEVDISPIFKMCLFGDLYSFNSSEIEMSSDIILQELPHFSL